MATCIECPPEPSSLIGRKLGRCGRCMWQVAAIAVISWVAVAVTLMVWRQPAILALGLSVGVGATVLGFAHLAAYLGRTVLAVEPAPQRRGALIWLARVAAATLLGAGAGLRLWEAPRIAEAARSCRKIKDSVVDDLVSQGPVGNFLDVLVQTGVITDEQRKKFGHELKKIFPSTEACLDATETLIPCEHQRNVRCCDLTGAKGTLDGITELTGTAFGITVKVKISIVELLDRKEPNPCPSQCKADSIEARVKVKVELELTHGATNAKVTHEDQGPLLKVDCKLKD